MGLPIGLVGSSSGGYLALAMARESAKAHAALSEGEAFVNFAFCVALCPVAHPWKRLQYLNSCIRGTAFKDGYMVAHTEEVASAMKAKQTAYWKTEEAMKEAGEELTTPGMLPTFVVLGGEDKNVPGDVTIGVQAWAKTTFVVGGHGHELQNADAL